MFRIFICQSEEAEKRLDVGVFHLMYSDKNILPEQKFVLVIDDSRCINAANAFVLFN